MGYIGYIRVSTGKQGESGAGLEAQRTQILAAEQMSSWTIDRIEQDILSGSSLRRPRLEAALTACTTGEAEGIVVAKLDRLSRSVIDFGRLLEQSRKQGWNLVALDFGVDLSTPGGELVANVLMSVAQWERRMIGQRTSEGMRAKATLGVRLGAPSRIPVTVSAEIRERRAAREPLRSICYDLNARGVPTPRGGRMWRPSSLAHLR